VTDSAGSGDAAAGPVVEFHDVTVAYAGRPVLWNVDLVITGPAVFGIVGPNGAGKSTLLKAALGLVPLAGGSIRFDWGFPVSVMDVVLMGTYGRVGWFRRPGHREREWSAECLRRVGLADLAGRQIGRLSGGQQQRVFLARALAQRARIYLLDEPMAGVDAGSQEMIFGVLDALRAEGRLIIVVHHDLRSAASWFDGVALIDMRLVAAGPTASVLTPKNLRRTYAGQPTVLEELSRAVATGGRTP
jgi:manganese/zinc/iron transport system ATP- binding protein